MTSHNTVSSISSLNLGDDPLDGKESSILRLQEESCRERHQCQATIDMLPDDVLLEIFDFYRDDPSLHFIGGIFSTWKWQNLTHVCQRWRDIVLGSPQRLELQVICTAETPTRTSLDIWPPFPITVFCPSLLQAGERGLENIIAAVECRNRISQVFVHVDSDGPAVERLVAVMEEPFPYLTKLCLESIDKSAPELPEAFLGGSAPLLESFILYGISFPAFPKFILSASPMLYLHLYDIPDSGYISPEEMATCLAALPNLEILNLGFRSPLSRPLRPGLPSFTRAVLPALISLFFRGTYEYLEVFLARTHIPLLKRLDIRFFMDLIFDIPRLRRFIVQAEYLMPLSPAWVMFDVRRIVINLGLPTQVALAILCEERDWQLSSLAQACGQYLPLSGVEQLSVCELNQGESLDWKDDMDSSQWLELFHPFIAVQSLHVSTQFVPFVTSALQELTGERTMEVLPALKNLFLEGLELSGPVQEAIKPFVAARQLSNYPIAIHPELPLPPPPPYMRYPEDH